MIFKKKADKVNETSFDKSVKKTKKPIKISKKMIVIIILIAVILAVGGFFAFKYIFKTEKAQTKNMDSKVTRGSIVNVIEGTGTVEARAQYEVKYLSSVDVLRDHFEEGDYVKKDQILYEMDAEDIDRSIKKQRTNVEKATINYNDAMESLQNLKVSSTISGVITELYVTEGDSVSNGAKIADIVNKDKLRLSIPFGAEDVKNMSIGQTAEVTLAEGFGETLEGKVTYIASGTDINSYGAETGIVQIEVTNPGGIYEGKKAYAVVGDWACYDSASFEYPEKETVCAESGGDIVSLNVHKGDAINAGTMLLSLESKNVEKTVREARLSLEDAQNSLEQLLESRADATIKSQIDGKVIQKNIKAGEILDSGTSSTMAIIADLSALKFDISIDELDISKISIGQEVTITADALSGQTFKGAVSNISIIGSAYQGVTSYPVTVTIENTDNSQLIPGMNVEAKIVIDSAENVLRVPVSALKMGNYVIAKDDGTFADPLEIKIPSFEGGRNFAGGVANKTQPDSVNNSKDEKDALEENAPSAPRGQKPDFSNGGFRNGERPDFGNAYRTGNGQRAEMGNADGTKQAESPVSDTPESRNGFENADKSASKENTSDNIKGKNSNGKKSGENGGFVMDEERAKEMKKRMKNMIESLDVPEGYTVVRVQPGLNDGTYVEIKEIEGSLKEGDIISIPAVASMSDQMPQFGGMNGGSMMGGGMRPGGMMGGGMSGGMSGGMRTGGSSFGGARSGGSFGGARSGGSFGGSRTGGMR